MTQLLTAAGSGAAAVMLWRIARALGLGLAGLAVFSVISAVRRFIDWAGTLGVVAIGLVALTLTGLVGVGLWCRWTHSHRTVKRWSAMRRRRGGVASTWQVLRRGSRWAVLRRGRHVRPSLKALSWWRTALLDAAQVGVRLVRVGLLWVWSSAEDVVLIFGGPRTGKSGYLAARIVDAPGMVLSTSTRTDLYRLTSSAREELGPVHVFNPSGLGELASTISFDPVSGCADPVVAMERAEDMIPMGDGSTDRDHWSGQARRALAGLLYTAAVGGYDMSQIGWWVAHQDDEVHDRGETVRPVAAQIEALLEDHDPLMADQVSAFLRTNERTRTSITNSMAPALAWLSNPAARKAATGEQPFDVEQLLRARATIYLLGAESGATAGLVAALTGHIAREARRLSAGMPGERLDPAFRLVLDEANLICPVPLVRWTADMGGRGVTIMAAFQSRAQLLSKWGPSSAAEIINNAGGIIVYGGTADRDDLQYWSAIIGDRDEVSEQTDKNGNVTGYSTRSVPVISPAKLRALPQARAVVLRRHLDPVVGIPGVLWRQRRLPVPEWLVRWHRWVTHIPGGPEAVAIPEPDAPPALALVNARSGEVA